MTIPDPGEAIRFEVTATKDGKVLLHARDLTGWVTAKFVLISLGYSREEAEALVTEIRKSLQG